MASHFAPIVGVSLAPMYYDVNKPYSIETVELDPPKHGEVLIKVGAAGVCRSDLHFQKGEATIAMPAVLGHMLRKRGTAVIVGIAPAGDAAAIEPVVLTRGEKTITGCYYGSAHPRQDMPRIADWVERGLLDVAGLVTRRYPLAEINRAYEDLETDAVGRGVLTFP